MWEKVRNFRQLYFCCGCSLKIGCYFIAGLELIYPILTICTPIKQETFGIIMTWFIYVSSSILLIYATHSDSLRCLLIWIIFRLVIFVLTVLGYVYIIKQIHKNFVDSIKLILFFAFSAVVFLGISGYFWTIVYSHYLDMKEKKRRELVKTPPAV